MSWPVRHISRFIDRPPAEVALFAGDPKNLPKWASGLSSEVTEENGAWVATSPMGEVRIVFASPNGLGVLDHDVTLPDGKIFHNPMRVLPNDGGSEIVFSLYRLEGVDDAAFEKDAATISGDLDRLKGLLESGR